MKYILGQGIPRENMTKSRQSNLDGFFLVCYPKEWDINKAWWWNKPYL